MKRLLHITALSRLAAIVTLLMMTIQTWAMTYEQAREQALFLTDKMAYELNLSQEQYEAAYEINLDYLMSVTTVDEVYSNYWYQRNIDMEYIMLDWQYSAFCATNYFYRPLYWDAGYWHFGVYAYYPHREVFYFERPAVYVSYRGSHGWRAGGGRSWYATRTAHYRGTHRAQHIGLRDGYDRRNGISRHTMSRTSSNINRQNMSGRNGYRSSTRTTVGNSNISNSGTYRNSRSSRSDNDDMYSGGRSSYRSGDNSSTGSYSGGSNYNRHSYGSSSSRQSYGSGSSNINRQSYGSSSSRQSYGGGSSNIGQMRGSSYSGSRSSSSSSYGGSRGNISSFGGSSSGGMGTRSSSGMGTRSSGGMGSRSSGGMGGGGSRGSMGRH